MGIPRNKWVNKSASFLSTVQVPRGPTGSPLTFGSFLNRPPLWGRVIFSDPSFEKRGSLPRYPEVEVKGHGKEEFRTVHQQEARLFTTGISMSARMSSALPSFGALINAEGIDGRHNDVRGRRNAWWNQYYTHRSCKCSINVPFWIKAGGGGTGSILLITYIFDHYYRSWLDMRDTPTFAFVIHFYIIVLY